MVDAPKYNFESRVLFDIVVIPFSISLEPLSQMICELFLNKSQNFLKQSYPEKTKLITVKQQCGVFFLQCGNNMWYGFTVLGSRDINLI